MLKIRVAIRDDMPLKVSIRDDMPLKVSILKQEFIDNSRAPYEGPYDIVPNLKEPTILHTKQTQLYDDIIIHEVPIHRTSNSSGTTVFIGKVVI